MPNLIFNPHAESRRDVLVLLLLDGGMDGLHTIPPHGDGALRGHRKRLAVAEPGRAGGVFDLDGFFGLHPRMAPLIDLFRAKRLAAVHACGSPDRTLSHFEAMRTLESGASNSTSLSSGWLSRYLATIANTSGGLLRAVAFGNSLPRVLSGSPDAMVLSSLADFQLDVPASWSTDWPHLLNEVHRVDDDIASRTGRDLLHLLRELRQLRRSSLPPDGGAWYGESGLGLALSQIVQLIKADVGLEVAVVRQGGWDAHQGQIPLMDRLMETLAVTVRAFHDDLGDRMQRVTFIAMTEFGRRVRENLAAGTDHGRGTAMFLLGGGVRGGRVYGRWPGLHRDELDSDGNLQITTDYRHVLAEVVSRRLGNAAIDKVFPAFQPEFLNCCAAAP